MEETFIQTLDRQSGLASLIRASNTKWGGWFVSWARSTCRTSRHLVKSSDAAALVDVGEPNLPIKTNKLGVAQRACAVPWADDVADPIRFGNSIRDAEPRLRCNACGDYQGLGTGSYSPAGSLWPSIWPYRQADIFLDTMPYNAHTHSQRRSAVGSAGSDLYWQHIRSPRRITGEATGPKPRWKRKGLRAIDLRDQ
jgi:hypothetical protein